MTIETSRLLLRPFTMDDADDVFDYAKHPEVGPRCGWPPHENREVSVQILAEHLIPDNGEQSFAIVDKTSGRVIASIGVKTMTEPCLDFPLPYCEIGYALHVDYWGKGLMPEAVNAIIDMIFSTGDVDEIYISHADFNLQSRRVIEKCGFEKIAETERYMPAIDVRRMSWYYRLRRSDRQRS